MPFKEGNTSTRIAVTIHDQDDAVVDVSGATTKTIRVVAPGGAVETIAASFDSVLGNGAGTDGKIFALYTTALVPGGYSFEAFVTIAGSSWYSEKGSFTAEANLG